MLLFTWPLTCLWKSLFINKISAFHLVLEFICSLLSWRTRKFGSKNFFFFMLRIVCCLLICLWRWEFLGLHLLLILQNLIFITCNLFVICCELLFKDTQTLILKFYFFIFCRKLICLLINDLFKFFNFSGLNVDSFLNFWLNNLIKFIKIILRA